MGRGREAREKGEREREARERGERERGEREREARERETRGYEPLALRNQQIHWAIKLGEIKSPSKIPL